MELLVCLVVHPLLLPGVRGLLCLFLTGKPQAPCPACRDWHAFPIHLTGKHHLHHLPVRLLGKKRAERRDWGSGQALLSREQEGIRRQGASQGLWPENGGSVPALAGKRVRKILTLAAVLAPHTLPFSSYTVSR